MSRPFRKVVWIFLTILASACARSRALPPKIGDARAADVPISSVGPWSFSHSPGTRAYRIARIATIEGTANSTSRRETVSNFTHQIVTFEATGEELSFKTVVDTFSVTTQGVVGPAQSVELPIELSGVITPVGLRLEGAANGTCNAARATAVTDIYNLIAIFPARLSKGATWRDSTVVSGCQAGIPTSTTTRRTFQISGEVIHSGRSLLLVTRADIINSRGAGAYNQHRMQVEGTGTGNALYYLDTRTGEVEHLVTAQTSEIQVATSGRLHSFTQSVNQEFVRAR